MKEINEIKKYLETKKYEFKNSYNTDGYYLFEIIPYVKNQFFTKNVFKNIAQIKDKIEKTIGDHRPRYEDIFTEYLFKENKLFVVLFIESIMDYDIYDHFDIGTLPEVKFSNYSISKLFEDYKKISEMKNLYVNNIFTHDQNDGYENESVIIEIRVYDDLSQNILNQQLQNNTKNLTEILSFNSNNKTALVKITLLE